MRLHKPTKARTPRPNDARTLFVRLPKELHKAVRMSAIKADMSTREFVTALLQKHVGET